MVAPWVLPAIGGAIIGGAAGGSNGLMGSAPSASVESRSTLTPQQRELLSILLNRGVNPNAAPTNTGPITNTPTGGGTSGSGGLTTGGASVIGRDDWLPDFLRPNRTTQNQPSTTTAKTSSQPTVTNQPAGVNQPTTQQVGTGNILPDNPYGINFDDLGLDSASADKLRAIYENLATNYGDEGIKAFWDSEVGRAINQQYGTGSPTITSSYEDLFNTDRYGGILDVGVDPVTGSMMQDILSGTGLYGGISNTLSDIMSVDSGEADRRYQESIVNPLMSTFEQDVLPAVDRRYASQGFFSSERDKSIERSVDDLTNSILSKQLDFYNQEQNRRLTAAGAGVPLMDFASGVGTEATRVAESNIGRRYEDFINQQKRQQELLDTLMKLTLSPTQENIALVSGGSQGILPGAAAGFAQGLAGSIFNN